MSIRTYMSLQITQSSIKAVERLRPRSGQYIIKEILDKISRIHILKTAYTIHLELVPGHMTINGNEQGDKAAKAAALQATLPPP